MSKSSRQIAHPKEFQRDVSSLSNIPPKRSISVQMRNFSQLLQRGKDHYNNNRMVEAIEIFYRGLYYDNNNSQLNYLLSVALMSIGNHNESLKHLKVVEKANNRYKPNLLLLLSIVYKKLNQLPQAIEAVNQHIEVQQNKEEGLLYRAKIFIQLNQYQNALGDLNTILNKNSKHPHAAILKVRVLLLLGLEDQVLSFLEICKPTAEEPQKLQDFHFQQIKIYAKRGLFEKAFEVFHQLDKAFPIPTPQSILLRAKLLDKSGRKQQSIMLYNQLLAKNSSSRVFSQAIAQCAIACMRQRDFYQALSYLKRTLLTKIKSKVTDQLFKLAQGLTFLMKKKHAQAIVLMGSCQLDFKYQLANHVPYLKNLLCNALAYGNFSLSNHQIALQFYKKIVINELSTDSVATSYNICICQGILHYKNGEKQKALSIFQKASSIILRPQPFFYIAVILNEQYLKQPINTEGFVKILELIEQGLKTGENAHLYFYRAILYLYLGMNSESLQDIDRAIQKSQDNVARYFYTRGIIFMLDKNWEQAILEFTTAISIDDADQFSIIEKAKCELITGDIQTAYSNIERLNRYQEVKILFMMHEKRYTEILMNEHSNQATRQVCSFMQGKFQEAGPSGKLILAIIYENYSEVVNLIEEAVTLAVPVGCLEANDLLILKAFSQYRLERYEEALITLEKVQQSLKQSNGRSQTYSEQDQRKLLLCRFNVIIINFKKKHQLQALSFTQSLISEICEGSIYDQLSQLKQFLTEGVEHQVDFGFDSPLLSDYFALEEQRGLRFKFLIPLPNYKVNEVQIPPYQQLLTKFSVADIQNKPEAPWIKRGQFGVIFTNQIRQFQNLNLKTEENEGVRSRLPTGEQSQSGVRKRSQLIEYLKLSASIVNKLDRMAKKGEKSENV